MIMMTMNDNELMMADDGRRKVEYGIWKVEDIWLLYMVLVWCCWVMHNIWPGNGK